MRSSAPSWSTSPQEYGVGNGLAGPSDLQSGWSPPLDAYAAPT